MVERITIKKSYFVYIAILTLLIFLFGVMVGYNLDQMKSNFLEREIADAILDSESFTVTQSYLQNNPKYCDLMNTRINQIAKTVEQFGEDLDKFSEKNAFVNYTGLNRRYFLYEIRFWLAVDEYKSLCNKTINNVLFFYQKNDTQSYEQGLVLTALKNDYKENIMIFSIDIDFKEPMIYILKEEYEITATPTLIINKVRYDRFMNKKEIESILK